MVFMRRFRLFVGTVYFVYFLAVIQYTVLLRHPIHLSQSPCGERVGVSNSSIRSTFILVGQGGAGAGIFYYEKIPGSKYILAVLLYHGGAGAGIFLYEKIPGSKHISLKLIEIILVLPSHTAMSWSVLTVFPWVALNFGICPC